MRRKNTQKLGSIIGQVLKNNNLEEKLYQRKVINSWKEVLGQNISYHTTKLEFINRTLYVYISSSVVRHELFLMKFKIKNSLNQYVGSNIVNDIIFR